jgi:hypothetical protein
VEEMMRKYNVQLSNAVVNRCLLSSAVTSGWMHTGFAQDRDGKNTLENVIIELSFDQEKFYSFM